MSEPEPYPYKSDRWVTPGVIVAGLIVAGLIIALIVTATAWLTSIGRDPEPLVRLVASLLAAAGALGSFALQLVNRRTSTKTERNTGTLGAELRADLDDVRDGQRRMADALWEVADALPRPVPRPRHASPAPAYGAAPAAARGE